MKVFMKNYQQIRPNSFASLLLNYSLVMISIISCFALLISYADWDMRESQSCWPACSQLEQLMRLGSIIESARLAQELVENRSLHPVTNILVSTRLFFYWQLERKGVAL